MSQNLFDYFLGIFFFLVLLVFFQRYTLATRFKNGPNGYVFLSYSFEDIRNIEKGMAKSTPDSN